MTQGFFGPPRLRIGGPDEERHATWLETFFDLVFVVAVSQVAHRLTFRLTIPAVLEYLALFVPIVWAWIGVVFYTDRFGTDGLGDRLAVLVQMAAAAVLAVSAGGALRFTSAAFALAYATIRVVMVVQYAFAWYYVPAARPITRRYFWGFLLAAVFWALSVLFGPPWRFILWGAGIAADFAVPLSAGQLHARFAPHTRHLPERFGLFTLIVLGETIVAVVAGLANHPWSWLDGLTGFLGLILAFSFWWLYFDNLDDAVIRAARERGRIWIYQSWLYAHFPLYAALAATGVGIAYAIRADQYCVLPAPQRWLVAGGAAVCFASLGIIHYAKALAGTLRCTLPRARVRWGGAVAALLIALLGGLLHPIGVLGLLAGVGVAEIAWEVWAGGGGAAAGE
jgi:low temperature requirement protein LtrA